jgi:hypothetical protein
MKSFIVSLVVLATSASAFAQQGRMLRPVPALLPGEQVLVQCRDARPIADAGIEVMVTTRQTARGLVRVMTVAEQSFFGPSLIGQLLVGEQRPRTNRGDFVNYVGQGVTLSIDMTPPARRGLEQVVGQRAFIRGTVNTVRLDHDLVCEFIMHAL